MSVDLGIDLGTASVLVYVKGKGVILKEPSVVAYDRDTNAIKAIGEEARMMLGRTPGNIVAVRPLRQGVISDYTVTEKMIKYFVQKALGKRTFKKPRISICVPSGVTEVERKAVEEATYAAGAREVHLIEEPVAAAIGAGIDISKPCGNMIVDIGGGTSDIAVISLGGTVVNTSLKIAGDDFDEAIVRYMRKKHNLLIGERTAEDIKIKIGTTYPLIEDETLEVRGRYMIMQSYDFYYMFQHNGCNMQFGGNDQWSNMLGGTELIRRKLGKDAHAMTITLLLNSEGKKMGKTASGAVWLDPNKTTPFDFYQYWRNVGDADVLKCIRMLTFLPLEQIDAMDAWEGSQLNQAKEILAYELTKLVHGEAEADKAQEAARALFGGSGSSENMPSTQLPEACFTDGKISAIELLVACGLCASNGEARRLIQQGGVAVNDQKVASIDVTFDQAQFAGDGVVIKKGKKVFHRAYTA